MVSAADNDISTWCCSYRSLITSTRGNPKHPTDPVSLSIPDEPFQSAYFPQINQLQMSLLIRVLTYIPKSVYFAAANAKLANLLHEEKGVEGCGFFSKVGGSRFHLLGKISRLAFALFLAPIFVIPVNTKYLQRILKAAWFWERSQPNKAILAAPPGGGSMAKFHPTGYRPTFVVKVQPGFGRPIEWEQIRYPDQTIPYTAISYPFEKARDSSALPETSSSSTSPNGSLAAGISSASPDPGLVERRDVAVRLLEAYVKILHPPTTILDDATTRSTPSSAWAEYIWIDELCLSEGPRVDKTEENRAIRNNELGRLADIFSGADKVVIFCDTPGCNHTSLDCPWSHRLFTIGEVFSAQAVTLMIRSESSNGFILNHQTGRQFRRSIQNSAELRDDALHLHTIMKWAPDPVDSQPMIHSLIVEALRRDDLGGYINHNQLGRALNGLLARRAQLEDVPGKDGWSDLCWLLELNQGHYNAASLAAVCSLDAGSDRTTRAPLRHPWLGKPVLPEPGTERLEPLVTAIPIVNPLSSQLVASALNIVGPKIVGLPPFPRRDKHALYTHKELRGVLLLTWFTFFRILSHNLNMVFVYGGSWLRIRLTFFLVGATQLVAETTCLDCEGWVHLDEETWGEDPSLKLGKLDRRLSQLKEWGHPGQQPVPKWHPSVDSNQATLVDLANGIFTRVHTLHKPKVVLPLAVHGSGITCMLLDRPEDSRVGSERVGMANLPPYILAQTKRAASVVVASSEAPGADGHP